MAAIIAPAATYTYSATGTAAPSTNGVDPFGNPWLISVSGGNVSFQIPGPFAGGPTQWLCPGCTTDIYVSAEGLFEGGPSTPLLVDGSANNIFRDVSTDSIFSYTISGNTIHYNHSPNPKVSLGDFVTTTTQFVNPFPPGALYSFTVTYVTDDCETPEPASYALLGAGFIGIALLKRRRLANQE